MHVFASQIPSDVRYILEPGVEQSYKELQATVHRKVVLNSMFLYLDMLQAVERFKFTHPKYIRES